MRPPVRIVWLAPAALAVAGCQVVPASDAPPPPEEVIAVAAPVIQPVPPPPSAPPPPIPLTPFTYAGELTQGGWIRGQAPTGTVAARLGEQALVLDEQGRFFAAFDRDAGNQAVLIATLADGRQVTETLAVSPRDWQIERVNVARSPGGSSAAFMERRRPELARINAAREVNAQSQGWTQQFIWPVTGRISGRFGSQRIYRGGEAGAYHSGLDIAGGNGTTYVAPADGVVTLATDQPFSLEGYLLIIDHGHGLNSAFLHNSALLVREGDVVRQGQPIARIGSTGRSTGPHLHWGIKWRDARLDPLLFLGPMP
ncbi:M23 family metallopeptidase [Altererythrobacter sp. KTW20L]|uniref:M23 family metallopeptidase n=1 Tax=Altererythrobacter sp. KTW20L TaxID=2942210 RepID=UPI0020BEADFD|nr:M23 family metallopeptidase [Altererythrobacter sp. KTW20L]MCL6250014.1 M23 family metallopeptidase [Altererythrobacter sp. KTW20L]